MPSVGILDCTIRDGSYLIDYQFTAEDTFLIAAALGRAGIRRIEVGHGLGLNAQYAGRGTAAESDTRYIEAAVAGAGRKAKVGVFFIPGIASEDNIRRAADAGIAFLRVGTNIDQYRESGKAVKLAAQLGLEVWSNLMKSYLVSPEQFAEICSAVAGLGSDVAVLVDSAGGMTPRQVETYIACARTHSRIALAFHGHNNLHLVMANCLAAVEAGAAYLDASLRGMGRSAGNAATEVLSAILAREGYDIEDIEWQELIRVAQESIAPIMPRDTGLLPVEIASGISYFHSSSQPMIDESSERWGVEPFETILEVGLKGIKSLAPDDAETAAAVVREAMPTAKGCRVFDSRWVHRTPCETLEELRSALRVLSSKTALPVVMTLARSRRDVPPPLRFTPVRLGRNYCIAHIETAGPEQDQEVFDFFCGYMKLWMADREIPKPQPLPEDLSWVTYDDDRLLVNALCDFLQMRHPTATVLIPQGRGRIVTLACSMIECTGSAPYDVGIALERVSKFSAADLQAIRSNGCLIVAQPDTVEAGVVDLAREHDIEIWRLDLSESLIAEVSRLFDGSRRLCEHSGRVKLGAVAVVAGGVVGVRGDIVVNSIAAPTAILGKADGTGGLASLTAADEEARRLVLEWMLGTNRDKKDRKGSNENR